MAIVLKNKLYSTDIIIHSNKIIGIIGNYERIIELIHGNSMYIIKKERYFSEKTSLDELNLLNDKNGGKTDINKLIDMFLKELQIDNFLNKSINDLSDSELRLLDYLCMLVANPRVIIIDEPFLYFDYELKKKISNLLRRIVKLSSKTIIVGSMDSNLIYSLCQKVLLLSDKDFYYGSIDLLKNNNILKKCNVEIPNIVQFVNLAHGKNIKLPYSYDVRDLIKDVYKNV